MFTLTIEDKHGGVADEYSFEEGEFLIGRSHGADIILPSDNVSRRHARLYTVDGRCYLEDLGSASGVFAVSSSAFPSPSSRKSCSAHADFRVSK